jgi:hypothetical protein
MRFGISAAIAAALLLAQPAAAQSLQTRSPQAQALEQEAAAVCSAMDNGLFDPGGAVTRIELKSQFGSVKAELVDESAFHCTSSASLYCGSGGCMLHLVAEGKVYSWQATGWRLLEWGPDVILLIGRDGGWCGGAGTEVCYEAVVWSDGRPLTVGEPPQRR